MSKVSTQDYIKIRREEYARLKKLQKHFEDFWGYLVHLDDIKKSRKDVERGRSIPQEELFKKVGL